MPRAFAYLRVPTPDQTTDNQLQEIHAAGFSIEPRRVVTETVSGSVATARRRGFARLLDRLEPGDVLVVTKLDRLGRDATDVGSTVAKLAGIGVRVHCLALGGVDLASSTGKLTMGVIDAVAEFERDLLVERTQAGLSRARAEGKRLGRPASLTAEQRRSVLRRLGRGRPCPRWRASSGPAGRPSCASGTGHRPRRACVASRDGGPPHSAEETPPLIAEGHIVFGSLPHLDLAGHAEDDGVKQVRALERERPGPHRHEIDVLHLVTSELDGTLAVAELGRGILAEHHRAEEVGRVEVVPARAAVLEVQPVGTPVLEHDAARPEREVDERDVDLLGP